jgi:hypothetical protein
MIYEQLMLAHYERIAREENTARACEFGRLPVYLPWRQRLARHLRGLAERLEPIPSAPAPIPHDLLRPAFSAKAR